MSGSAEAFLMGGDARVDKVRAFFFPALIPPTPSTSQLYPHPSHHAYLQGESSRMSSFMGAIAIADLVKTTLGPKGMDKILQSVRVTPPPTHPFPCLVGVLPRHPSPLFPGSPLLPVHPPPPALTLSSPTLPPTTPPFFPLLPRSPTPTVT